MAVPAKFPPTTDLLRIQDEQEYYNLVNSDFFNAFYKRTWFYLHEFFYEDEEKMKLLALPLNISPLIVKATKNFLFGKPVKIEVDDKSDGDGKIQKAVDAIIKRTNLQQKLKDSCMFFAGVGHTQFKLRADVVGKKRMAVIEEVPFNNWFPDWDTLPEGQQPNHFFILAYISQLTGDDILMKKYIYVEEHNPGEIAYRLFYNVDGRIGEQLPLATIPNLLPTREGQTTDADGLTVTEKTGIEQITLVQIDAEKTVKDRAGQSLLKPVRPLLDEVCTRLTQLSMQIMKHLDPILQVPTGALPLDANGNVQRKKLEVYQASQGDPDVKYITNDNPMVEQTFKYLDILVEKCAKLTETPQSFLMTDDKGGVESAEALRTRFMLFLKRIENYRQSYAGGIEQILKLALAIEGVKVPDDIEFKITFDYGLPKDPELEGKIWGNAVLDGIASVETAVAQFQGLEGDLLKEELAKIKKDTALALPPQPQKTTDPLELTAA